MIKTLRSLTIYFLGILVSFVLVLLVFSAKVLAQSPAPSPNVSDVPTADIKFPIDELGGCADIGACMEFCEDPVNNTRCSEYAKEKGFYREDPVIAADSAFWEKAKAELGCDSKDACLDYCSQEGNFDKCDEFTKKYGLVGGYTAEPDKPEFLEIAKEVLGCDSFDSCSNICDDPANAQKCTEFADRVGVLGGQETEGPGGCKSQETCESFCSDPANFPLCQSHASPDGTFAGPGGCDSEVACRAYCEQNSDDCRSYTPGANGNYVTIACDPGEYHGPQGVCTPVEKIQEAAVCASSGKFWNGDSCQDSPPDGVTTDVLNAYFEPKPEMGNCDTPGECYDWCRENEGKCAGFDPDSPRPGDTYTPYIYYTPGSEVRFEPKPDYGNCDSPGSCYDWCSENAGKCQGFDPESPRPLDNYVPGAYYTPPADIVYITPSATSFYTTPIYYTPPPGSNYTTPTYYTPGSYYTPSYYTPPDGSNYVTPTYYTPGISYFTPSGEYPTPNYPTPRYYTPPVISGYTTPYYYTPPPYITPYYYTPFDGNYTTPSYATPPVYTTPVYFTPYTGGSYVTPVYYTPPVYTTPTYYTPPPGSNYTTPNYYTPPPPYVSPSYYTPGTYPTPPTYVTPPPYSTPTYSYPTPGSYYTTPSYYTPQSYYTPSYYTPSTYYTPSYYTPYYYTPSDNYTTPSYSTPSYYYPSPSGEYTYPSPSYYSPSYSYPTPGSYYYPSPSYSYPTPSGDAGGYSSPSYSYPTPSGSYSYPSPSYYTPSYSYPSPTGSYSYPTPSGSYSYPSPSYSYPTPSSYSYPSPSYGTPTYGTPSYGTPEYPTPSYNTPSSSIGREVAGAKTGGGIVGWFRTFWSSLFGR